MDGPASKVKRFVFWDYPRAGWQYDVMVGLILLFIFLTPRDWFRDQPRPSSVTMIPSAERGATTFWMAPDTLAGVPESERLAKSSVLLKTLRGKKYNVVRLEPIFDSEQEIQGYIAYTNP